MKGKKANLTKDAIKKAINGRTWKQAAKLLGVSTSCLRANASKFGVYSHFTNGKNPKLKTFEIIDSIRSIGVNETAKKFRISIKKLNARIYVWRHRGMIK